MGDTSISDVTSSCSTVPLLYIECSEKDEIFGEKLSSVFGYAIGDLQGSNNESSYEAYCLALKKTIGGSEPYSSSQSVKEKVHEIFLQKVWSFLPYKEQKYEQYIEKSFEKTMIFNDNVHKQSYWLSTESRKEAHEFVVKIVRSKNNLEIIPTFTSINVRKKIKSRWPYKKSLEYEANIEYKQQKFFLTQFDIAKFRQDRPLKNSVNHYCEKIT